MKYSILDDIGHKFIDHAAELVKSGHRFVYVLDNIDWDEKAHDMRQEVQNKSVHAVATSIVFNCVSDTGLPDSGPQKDLKDCNVHELVNINPLELEAIRNRYRILVAKLIFEHFPCFALFKQYVPESTNCIYPEEMAQKSVVITMPIIMKDEKKYAEVVDVLDQLETWTHKYIQLLDFVHQILNPVMTPPPQLEPRPDQINLPHMSHHLLLIVIHCVVLRCHALVINSPEFGLLEQETLDLVAIQQSRDWTTCIHFVSWTGTQREVS